MSGAKMVGVGQFAVLKPDELVHRQAVSQGDGAGRGARLDRNVDLLAQTRSDGRTDANHLPGPDFVWIANGRVQGDEFDVTNPVATGDGPEMFSVLDFVFEQGDPPAAIRMGGSPGMFGNPVGNGIGIGFFGRIVVVCFVPSRRGRVRASLPRQPGRDKSDECRQEQPRRPKPIVLSRFDHIPAQAMAWSVGQRQKKREMMAVTKGFAPGRGPPSLRLPANIWPITTYR